MRLEAGSATGTSIGETRRINRVALMVHRMGKISMGMDFKSLIPVEFQRSDQQQADNATPLFSGIHRDSVSSQYDFEGQICFRQSSPLPGMLESITAFLETNDV